MISTYKISVENILLALIHKRLYTIQIPSRPFLAELAPNPKP
jgi:hypothetical protein